MSVTAIYEIPDGRSFDMRYQGRKIVRTYDRAFVVETNYSGTGQLEVATTIGLPRIGDFYLTPTETDTGAFVISIRPEQQADNPYHWIVRVSYSSDSETALTTDGKGSGNPADATAGNPINWQTKISCSSRINRSVLYFDYQTPNRAVVNSSGERFATPVEYDLYNTVISITKNTLTFDPVRIAQYKGCVNKTVWYGVQPRNAKINDWVGEQAEQEGIVYWVNRIEVEIQLPIPGGPKYLGQQNGNVQIEPADPAGAGGWDLLALNEGYVSFSNDGKHTRVSKNSDGSDRTAPVLLDANGAAYPNTVVTSGAIVANAAAQTVTVQDGGNYLANSLGASLRIGNGNDTEDVVVVAPVSATTFSAVFTNNHAANCIVTGTPIYVRFWKHPRTDFNVLRILP